MSGQTKDRAWSPTAAQVWESRYRDVSSSGRRESSIEETWERVASALAQAETNEVELWQQRFLDVTSSGRFLPGGRIIAGAGVERSVTLSNCFVMGELNPDPVEIVRALQEGMETMRRGGGVGYDFSTLPPEGESDGETISGPAGPVAYMHVWETMCNGILDTGIRQGAMMATLRCDHPDVEKFVACKQNGSLLRHFNISVLVSDALLDAVRDDSSWPLVFPVGADDEAPEETVVRAWSGSDEPRVCRVYRRVRARDLWEKLLRAAYDVGEPGVLFVDTINRMNNLWYCESISATNPCGEVPLPAYGACDLGSLNLTQYVEHPFTDQARLDIDQLAADTRTAIRMLDNVIDISDYPLPQQKAQAVATRRIGLGVTGLGDALAMLNLCYDAAEGRRAAEGVAREMSQAAYRASIELAREKGPFPLFDSDRFIEGSFVATLPDDIRDGIRKDGIRNSHVLAIAPAGSISLLAGNVSSGIEPIFARRFKRRVAQPRGRYRTFEMTDYAYKRWSEEAREPATFPPAFVEAQRVAPEDHLAMQAVFQRYVDNAIAKTINLPADATFESFKTVFEKAHELGLKGCTVFRPRPGVDSVIVNLDTEIVDGQHEPPPCGGERRRAWTPPVYVN